MDHKELCGFINSSIDTMSLVDVWFVYVMTLSKICFQITNHSGKACQCYCLRITLFIVKLSLQGALFQNNSSSQFPIVDKPLNPLILSTGIFLGTNDAYTQQEVDFDYYTAL